MNGSPNSSMMLRSQCRSTPELLPTYHYVTSRSVWITLLVCIFIQYLIYYHYISPLEAKISRLEENYDSCLREAQHIVKREIDYYDADKTNQTDYALESSGATVVTTRCTKSYLDRNVQYSIDGLLPVFFTSNSPRVVIQPSITPGECWSFAGAEGVLVIQLSRTIIPTSFTYEHIRKELTPDLHIDSAPKHFRIKSLKDANDQEGLLLGEYTYDKDGDPLQQFNVQNPNPIPTRFIELLIQSNHGELQYTCLYRFRVHGNKL